MNKYFSLPGYYCNFTLIKLLINYKKKYPEFFIQDHIIESVYDFPPTFIWGGGRAINTEITYEQLEESIAWFRAENIQMRHVCSNMLLNESHLQNEPCNLFFKIFVDENNDKVIIYSPLLKKYLHSLYPNLEFIYSTTLGIIDIAQINNLTKNNIYVINYNQNNNIQYLSQLKYPENIEILCGEPCIEDCPYKTLHYKTNSKIWLKSNLDENDILSCKFNPPYKSAEESFQMIMQFDHAITLERIQSLANLNITHFKITGRDAPPPLVLKLICYYLVKPEYLNDVYLELLVEYFKIAIKNNI